MQKKSSNFLSLVIKKREREKTLRDIKKKLKFQQQQQKTLSVFLNHV